MQYLQKFFGEDFYKLINADKSGTLQALRLDLTSLLQGTTARSCVPEEPIQYAQNNPAWFTTRLHSKPAYLLFNRTIYHVHFRNNTPIVQRCLFKDPLPEHFEEILTYFPAVGEALECDINQKLDDITDTIEPIRISFPAGTTARSCVSQEPIQLAKDNPSWFATRLANRPSYLLFNETIYHVHFQENSPIVQRCTFKHPRSEHFKKVLTYFPKETDPLINSIDEELDAILDTVVPSSIGFPEFKIGSLTFNVPAFNSKLLRRYFAQPINPQNPALPLIEFSQIHLLAIENEFDVSTLKNENFIPTLVYNKETKNFALYGYHKQWRLTPINQSLINDLGLEFCDTVTEVNYDARYTLLYLHILEEQAHIHYDTLPNQVSQMRKIVAGIYYLQNTFYEIEHSVSSISNVIQSAFEYYWEEGRMHDLAHHSISLFLADDINLSERFANQIVELFFLLERFQDYSKSERNSDIQAEAQSSWSYYIGYLMGFTTRHIHSKNGDLNFETLSKVAADMPKHLDHITTWMNQHTDNIHQYAPNINEKELKALQKEANKLLAALKMHQTTQLNAIQIINYIYLIRQVIILLINNAQQVGHLHKAYQELLFTYLNITKEQLFPKLFAIIDKIEIEFIIDPGSLSQPCMQWITQQFEYITSYIQHLANFNFQPELLRLEDARFMKHRRAAILALKNECTQTQITLEWSREQTQVFFDTLRKNPEKTQLLIQKYKFLEPYLKKIAPEVNDRFLELYNDESPKSALDAFSRDDLLIIQHRLKHYFSKAEATEQLRLQQCDALIDTIDNQANLTVFPYNVFEGFDIELRLVGKHTDIKKESFQKNLPNNRFVLIQNHDHTYYTWGSDGAQFVLQSIQFQLIPENIQNQFKLLADSRKQSLVLPYHSRYSEFYSHVSTLRTHIQYASPLHCSETVIFQDTQCLSQLMMTPIDLANEYLLSEPIKLRKTEFFPKKRRLTPSQINSHDQHNLLIADLQQLSLNEAWAIYHLYDNKINEFENAKKAFTKLQALIDRHFPQDEDVLKFENKTLQKMCRRLYQYIQPYLSELPRFLYFDRDFVHALYCTDDTDPIYILSKIEFREHLASFTFDKSDYHKRLDYWASRALASLRTAKHRYIKTHEQSALKIEPTVVNERAGLILQTTRLSTFVTSIKKSLYYWIPMFNTYIRDRLRPAKIGIPYPNMPPHANVSPYIRFCIRLINTVYHLEQLALTLERLEIVTENTSSSKKIKAKNIKTIQTAYNDHIQPLQRLGTELYNDPEVSGLRNTFNTEILRRMSQGSALIKPYFTDIKLIQPLNKSANYPALWRVMNALYLIPNDLQNLIGNHIWDMGHTLHLIQTPIDEVIKTPDEECLTLIKHGEDYHIYGNSRSGKWQLQQIEGEIAQQLVTYDIDFTQSILTYDTKYQRLYIYLVQNGYHVTPKMQATEATLLAKAKEATLLIEYLIKNAESYVNLLFSAWSIYRLNLELREQLAKVAETSHNAVVNNLEIIHRKHFGRFIKKLDNLERDLSLKAGAFTKPAKQTFDAWYQGLIYPLDIPFPEKEALVCDSDTTQQRITIEQTCLDPHATAKRTIEEKLNIIQAFKQGIEAAQLPIEEWKQENSSVEHQKQQTETTDLTPTNVLSVIGSFIKTEGVTGNDAIINLVGCVILMAFLSIAKKLPKAPPPIPETLVDRYRTDIRPMLEDYLTQFSSPEDSSREIPKIIDTLNNNSVQRILNHIDILEKALESSAAQHQSSIWNSEAKIEYLRQLLAEDSTFRKNYRKSFAQHYFNEQIEKYCKPEKSLSNEAIATEYATMLKAHFCKQLDSLLRSSQTETHVDTLINTALQDLYPQFKNNYKPYYEQLNQTLTAVRLFKTYLEDDTTLDKTSRERKTEILNELQRAIMHQEKQVTDLESHLIARLQAIQNLTLKHKKELLEEPPHTSKTCFQWLKDCVLAILTALGLYSTRTQQHYDALTKASVAPIPVDSCLNCFGLFRAQPQKKTVNEDAKLVYQTHRL